MRLVRLRAEFNARIVRLLGAGSDYFESSATECGGKRVQGPHLSFYVPREVVKLGVRCSNERPPRATLLDVAKVVNELYAPVKWTQRRATRCSWNGVDCWTWDVDIIVPD